MNPSRPMTDRPTTRDDDDRWNIVASLYTDIYGILNEPTVQRSQQFPQVVRQLCIILETFLFSDDDKLQVIRSTILKNLETVEENMKSLHISLQQQPPERPRLSKRLFSTKKKNNITPLKDVTLVLSELSKTIVILALERHLYEIKTLLSRQKQINQMQAIPNNSNQLPSRQQHDSSPPSLVKQGLEPLLKTLLDAINNKENPSLEEKDRLELSQSFEELIKISESSPELSKFLTDKLFQFAKWSQRRNRTVEGYTFELTQHMSRIAPPKTPEASLVLAKNLFQLSKNKRYLSLREDEHALLLQCFDVMKPLLPKYIVQFTWICYHLANVQNHLWLWEREFETTVILIKLYSLLVSLNHPNSNLFLVPMTCSMNNLSNVLARSKSNRERNQALKLMGDVLVWHSVITKRSVHDAPTEDAAGFIVNLSLRLARTGRHKEAFNAMQHGIDWYDKAKKEDVSASMAGFATALYSYSLIAQKVHENDISVNAAEKCLDIRFQLYSQDHCEAHELAASYKRHAKSLRAIGKYEDALRSAEASVGKYRAISRPVGNSIIQKWIRDAEALRDDCAMHVASSKNATGRLQTPLLTPNYEEFLNDGYNNYRMTETPNSAMLPIKPYSAGSTLRLRTTSTMDNDKYDPFHA